MNSHINLITEHHSNYKFPLSIYSISGNIPAHYHDNFEIICVHEGCLELYIGNKKFDVSGQSIFFINMYQVHFAHLVENKTANYSAIVFDKKILEMVNLNPYYIDFIKPFIDGSRQFLNEISRDTEIFNLLSNSIERIIEEYTNKDRAYELFIATELERLFATMIRYHVYLGDDAINQLPLSHKTLRDSFMIYIEDNFQNPISLDTISKYLNINKHYFCRLIKKITGKTFTEVLNMYRIGQAEQLIKSKDLPITRVAELSGFTNLSYFNRMFLKYIGHTPRAYRNLLS